MEIEKAITEALRYYENQGFSSATIEWYRMGLRLFSDFLDGENISSVEEVTYQVLQEYLLYLRTRPKLTGKPGRLALATINIHIKAIRGLFRYLVDEVEVLETNPAAKLRKIRDKFAVVPSFTAEQVKKIISAIPKTFTGLRDRILIQLLLDTGLRISEALSIHVGDIDFTQSLIQVLGKGNRERQVPFGQQTKKELQVWITEQNLTVSDRIFFAERGKTITSAAVRNRMKIYGQTAGIAGVRPHKFRHTFALMFLNFGGDSLVLQIILGHSTLDMTKKYLNLKTQNLIEAHRRSGPVDKLNI